MMYWHENIHQSLRPLKHCCKVNPSVLPETTDPDWEFDYIDIGSVTLSEGVKHKERMRFEASPSRARKLVQEGDVLVSTVRTYLRAIAAVEPAEVPQVASTGFAVLRADKRIDPRFLYRVVQSNPFVEQVVSLSTGVSYPAINPSTLANIEIPLPDLLTQRQIADFLDRETARIDLLIEKKQRLVALLGDKLHTKISTLVKKGAVAPAVRLRHVLRLNPSARQLRLSPDAAVTFCPMEAIENGVGGIDVSNTRLFSEVAAGSYNFFAEGDVLLAKVTPCFENGKKALARKLTNGVGYATSEVFVIRVDPDKVDPEYLIYVLSSSDFQYAGRSSMTGAGGLRRISERSILDFPLFVTGIQEQRKIVEEIDFEVALSRKITEKTSTSIDRLKEYRSALITAAVTGQIDVSKWSKSDTGDRHLDTIQSEFAE
jgi:type I restriction enzyme S subunit